MKKFRTTALMVLSAIVIVAFVGCTKDNENNGGGNNGGGNNNGNTCNGHEYVDLGLPSGTLWATCNVGASTPEGYGDYFAWGETAPKEFYSWATYKWCYGFEDTYEEWGYDDITTFHNLTKYCNDSNYGYNGFCDDLTVLQSADDAATVKWGNGWRTPTGYEWDELLHYTTRVQTFQNNVKGVTFTSANGNSIFMPYTGWKRLEEIGQVGTVGYYWSGELCQWSDGLLGSGCVNAYCYDIYEGQKYGWLDAEMRYCGLTVRPVRSAK